MLILHAANYEYICLRHRETQTLYVSDILHVPFLKDPGYGKVQIGIYIIALEDALQRITLDSVIEGRPPSNDAAGGQNRTHTHIGANRGRGRSRKRRRTIDDPEVNHLRLPFPSS